ADDLKRLTAADVITLWEPKPEGVVDFQQFVASPRETETMAAATFRVVGPSFENLWNYYAGLCGIPDRFDASQLLVKGKTGAKGTYVVSDRASSDSPRSRALSVFMLRNERFAVSVTIEPDPAGKAILGSIAALTR